MNVIYLANVGTRDLNYKGGLLPKDCRRAAEDLLGRYNEVSPELHAPILACGLAHAIQNARHISRLLLFGSDQEDERYRQSDTIYAARVLQRYLRARFAGSLDAVEVHRIPHNPADCNLMFDYFARLLPGIAPPESVDVVYVAPVGGADASNAGLWVNAARIYRRKVQLLYVTPEARVYQLRLAAELLKDDFRRQAEAHLAARDYVPLERLLKAEPDFPPAWAAPLAASAHHRQRFDMETARQALAEACCLSSGETRAGILGLADSLATLKLPGSAPTSASPPAEWDAWLDLQRCFLAELFLHVRIKNEQQEWLEFLGRLFRLHEALLRFAFEVETRHNTDGNDSEGFPDFALALAADQALQAYLREQKITDARPTTYALARVLTYWVTKAGKGPQLGPVRAAVQAMEKLSSLRNKSVHGYEPVGRSQIEQQVSPEGLMNAIAKAFAALSVVVPEDPFAHTDALLREGMGLATAQVAGR